MTGRIAIFGYGRGRTRDRGAAPVGRPGAGRGAAARAVRLAEGGSVRVRATRSTARPVLKAARGAEQIVVAIGFEYSGIVWREAWPKAIANFVGACKATGARMVFIDNLYMYGPQTAPLVETMPLADIGWKPAARSAATRIWMAAAAAGEARIAALRAPDFYGPGVGNSYLGDTSIGKLALRASPRCSSARQTSCTTTPTCPTSPARR